MAPNKFGLGRGLADIRAEMGTVPEISVLAGTERVAVRQLHLDRVYPNPDQPRKSFQPAELDGLAKSIREKGVLQPILVRARGGNYEIIAGERRWRAAKIAGLTEIPALVKEFDDASAMEVALIENIQRENLTPIEEAAGYKNLMDKCGYTPNDVAKIIGKSLSYLANSVRLLTLPESVQKMLEDGLINTGAARALVVSENAEELARMAVEKKMNVREVEEAVRRTPRRPDAQKYRMRDLDVARIAALEKNLNKVFGLKTKLKVKKNGSGQVIITFRDLSQAEKLVK